MATFRVEITVVEEAPYDQTGEREVWHSSVVETEDQDAAVRRVLVGDTAVRQVLADEFGWDGRERAPYARDENLCGPCQDREDGYAS
ncbi:MAG: hypothetical protein GEV06_28950 [Luteitalea sp.]|nr:hypothetical protein [Luteitalea sp.]